MATVTAFVCNGTTSIRTVNLATDQYGTCQSGQGQWKTFEVVEPFNPANLNSAELSGGYGAGFVVMAIGLVIAWSAKQVVRAIK
jgi:hypothetical protein